MPLSRTLTGRVRRWWSRALLRRKVLVAAVVALLVALPAVVVVIVFQLRVAEARQSAEATQDLLDDLQALQDTTGEATDAVLFYSIDAFRDVEQLEIYERATAEIPEQIAQLERDVPSTLAQPMAEVSDTYDDMFDALAAVVDSADISPGEVPEGEGSLVDVFITSTTAVVTARHAVGDLEAMLGERLGAQRQDVTDLEGYASRAVIASWIVAFVAVVGGTVLVVTGILRRARRVTENGERFVRGETLLPLPASGDELGQLAGGMFSIGGLLDQRREEAVAATQVRDKLLARISQEMRPPLSEIIRRGEALTHEELAPPARQAADHVVKGGGHLLALIDDLRDISKIEAGDLAIATEPVLLHDVVGEAVTLISSRAATRSVTLHVEVAEDLVVMADRRRLQQVLLNLLSNAVKYNRTAGEVHVTAAVWDGMIRIGVADTGTGISPENQRRLFRAFERLGAAGSGIEGSGIGLALAKHLVSAMGGAIGVDSVEDQGTTFWVDLPAATAQRGASVPSPHPGPNGRGDQENPVLVESTSAAPEGSELDVVARGRGADEPGRADGETTADTDPSDESRSLLGTIAPERRKTGTWSRNIRLWWQDTPVRRKLLLVAVAALVISLPAAVLAVALEVQLADVRSSSETTQQQIDDMSDLRDMSADATTSVSFFFIGMLAGEDPENIQDHADDLAALEVEALELAAQLERDLPSDLQASMQEVSSALELQLAEFGTLTELSELSPTFDQGTVDVYTSGGLAGRDVREGLAALRSTLNERLVAEQQDVSDQETLVSQAVVGSWVVTFVAVVGGAAVVTTDIVRRLERLSENGRRFITGEPLLPLSQSRDEIGQLIGGMLAVAGLLDQRRQEAVAATRIRDEFLSRVSHELRTPLTAIIGFGEVLEDEGLAPDAHESARRILQGGEHLLSLSDDLLDLSKVETGHLVLDVDAVTLHHVADEAVASLRPDASMRSVSLTVDVAPDLEVAADRQRLLQVLTNLVSNAIKFNRPGGHVELAAGVHDGTVRVSVSDTGQGISAPDQQRLFQPFERLDAVEAGVEGTGIGLALTKHLVDAMGGTIGVTSEPGHGATFWFTLPPAATITQDPGSVTNRSATSPAGGSDYETGPLVLYVDANPVDVGRVGGLFQQRPERLQTLPEGRAVPNIARLLSPRLILLAADLPDTEGEAVLRQLKAMPETAKTPVVIVAAQPTSEYSDLLFARGATAILSRPVNTARLTGIIDAHL